MSKQKTKADIWGSLEAIIEDFDIELGNLDDKKSERPNCKILEIFEMTDKHPSARIDQQIFESKSIDLPYEGWNWLTSEYRRLILANSGRFL